MIKTYTYKIKHDKKFIDKFDKWIGSCRFLYNCAKELKENSYKNGVILNNYDLQKQLTEAKKEIDFLNEVHSQTLQSMLDRLDNAYKKYFKELKSGLVDKKKKQYIKKKSKNDGVINYNKLNNLCKPKWLSKKHHNSIPFKSIKLGDNGFILPKFGKVKVFEFKELNVILKTANIVKEADGYYLKIVVDTLINKKSIDNRDNQSICGIDMGLKYFAVTSDGEYFENPKHLFKHLDKLRVENRKLSRMDKKGKNYQKQVNKLQKIYLKIKRCRLDHHHKITSYLAENYDYVVVEDLNISDMVRNKNLSKHILDSSWGLFFELLKQKTEVISVDPKYTSQKCSNCGHISKENRKTQEKFKCVECGHESNADYNASNIILMSGQRHLYANVTY
jgi:putative transposase